MLSKFSDIEICRGGVRTNRGPWAGGPRRAGRRDGSVARGGCGFISTHRTRRVEFCRIPRRRTYVEWRCISDFKYHIPIRSHYGSDQSKYQSQARSVAWCARSSSDAPIWSFSGPVVPFFLMTGLSKGLSMSTLNARAPRIARLSKQRLVIPSTHCGRHGRQRHGRREPPRRDVRVRPWDRRQPKPPRSEE